MIAIGIDIHGEEREFDCTDGIVSCSGRKLISIIIPEGVTHVFCHNNQLTELKLPESVIRLWTDKEVMGLEKYMGTKVNINLW